MLLCLCITFFSISLLFSWKYGAFEVCLQRRKSFCTLVFAELRFIEKLGCGSPCYSVQRLIQMMEIIKKDHLPSVRFNLGILEKSLLRMCGKNHKGLY